MYGYEVPHYVREYLYEWRRNDRLLRVRRSLDNPGMYILERKTVYLADCPARRETDLAVQRKDGYRTVLLFWPNEIQFVSFTLWANDIQRRGGAKIVAAEMLNEEERVEELLDRAYRLEVEAATGELYDRLAWEEKRRISLARTQ